MLALARLLHIDDQAAGAALAALFHAGTLCLLWIVFLDSALTLRAILVLAIAAFFPVDSAAHLGGLLSGGVLGLLAPLPMLAPQPWHRLTQWFLIASALALFAGEGAAVAWAAKPKPRTLRGAHVEAQVPGMLVPVEPGVALLPGAAYVEIRRDDEPLSIEPGEDAIRIGDRTWVREKDNREGKDITLLAAGDGSGRLVIEFACGADFCRGAKGQQMYELVARSIRTIH